MSLDARHRKNQPIGVTLIGAGKFGSMFLAQVPTMPRIDVRYIVDLYPDRVRNRLAELGWSRGQIESTVLTTDLAEGLDANGVQVVIEATGDPVAGISHALAAIEARKHLVMVNVEADVLAGPALARRAREKGVCYSLAYGDQPALIAEQVDWARACGFRVAAAGKGTKYLPEYHASTPDTVWGHYGLTPEQARAAGMNSQMFNSFLDGTKSAIEMAAVANACGLDVPENGLAFPPCGAEELAEVLAPATTERGIVEVVSSLNRDGSPVDRDLRWGVYVVLEALSDYAAACFKQYGMQIDRTGRLAAMYRPYHLIGMELAMSVYSTVLRGHPTGMPLEFRGDVVAVAKRDLVVGEKLDGEGGYAVWGKLMPAAKSVGIGALPIGFAKGIALIRPVRRGEVVRLSDVGPLDEGQALTLRKETLAMVASA